ncbi:unnamed protein product [Amoebophrya sp. A120]|nr:unnamed protein product [Amoebophrya sp. A120]|eukprot:GSA120T00011884001.1
MFRSVYDQLTAASSFPATSFHLLPSDPAKARHTGLLDNYVAHTRTAGEYDADDAAFLGAQGVGSYSFGFSSSSTSKTWHDHNHRRNHLHNSRIKTAFNESPTFQIVSGITAAKEHCLVADAPDRDGTGFHLAPCDDQVRKMNGHELYRFMDNGALYTLMGKKCMTLEDGKVTASGGSVTLQDCDAATAASDGRALWEPMPSSQLKVAKVGDYCLSMGPEKASIGETNLIKGSSSIDASSSNGTHTAKMIADGNDSTYWASDWDPSEPETVTIDLGSSQKLSKVDIDWEYPPKSFSIESSSDGHHFSSCNRVNFNDKWTYHMPGRALKARYLRIKMHETHPTLGQHKESGRHLYGIQHVRVVTRALQPILQKCSDAARSADARDKWFLVEVTEFNPCKNPKLDLPPQGVPQTTQFAGNEESKDGQKMDVSGVPSKEMMSAAEE